LTESGEGIKSEGRCTDTAEGWQTREEKPSLCPGLSLIVCRVFLRRTPVVRFDLSCARRIARVIKPAIQPGVVLLAAIAIASTACRALGEEPALKNVTTETWTYKTTPQGELAMRAYLPAGWSAEDRRPAAVFFFGGGWAQGTIDMLARQAEYLASRGMVAACADYRVKSRHGVTPEACVEDARSAIRWIRQNADRLGVDRDRIVGSGASAGAHIVTCAAMTDGPDAPTDDLDISCKSNVLVLYIPGVDLIEFRSHWPPGDDFFGLDKETAEKLSPSYHVTPGAPPTLVIIGTKDGLYKQVMDFVDKMKKAGNSIEVYIAEGQEHGTFFNRTPWFERTTGRVDEFLRSLGYLEGPPPCGW